MVCFSAVIVFQCSENIVMTIFFWGLSSSGQSGSFLSLLFSVCFLARIPKRIPISGVFEWIRVSSGLTLIPYDGVMLTPLSDLA